MSTVNQIFQSLKSVSDAQNNSESQVCVNMLENSDSQICVYVMNISILLICVKRLEYLRVSSLCLMCKMSEKILFQHTN